MIGSTISRYRIVEKLGAGSMGEVYRAEDARLGRQVALKVLPQAIASAAENRARFEREAQAVAALSHPNVLAIHDFGFEGEVAFAVMELLQGETLRDEIDRLGALPVRVALDRAIQAARGLAAAHAKGIVHRDLKPENLFVTEDGQLKILDFGLAKVAAPGSAGADAVTVAGGTEPGTICGTFAYMAPEQAKGGPVGASADLFALGVILYEMLSGQNPFRRDSAAETISAILRDPAPPLEPKVAGLPRGLTQIVRHCLEKSPANRAHSAQDLAYNLEACRDTLTAPAAPAAEPQPIDSLAVLPFVNESGAPEADYLSDGIAEMIIDNLSQLPRLRVMAQSTVLQYRAQLTTPLEIGTALKVRAVLTGRLLQHRETLIVRAELVDATDGRRLWGGRFDRSHAGALLEIEEQISREICDKLRYQLSPEEKSRIAKRDTEHPEAHTAYLQGRHVWNRWKTPEGMRTAIGFFERALELDPLYARAFAGLADSYSMLGNIKALAPDQAYPRAKTAAQQGLAIDDRLAELHTSLAFIHRHWDWDWAAAEKEYRRAIELNPGYAMAHRWYGHLLAGLGRHQASIEESQRAVELEPQSLIIRGALGDSLFYARRYEEAIACYRQTIEMDPQFLAGHTDLARALELAGRYDEALEEFRIAASLAPKGPPDPSSGLAHVYAQMGRRDQALEIVEQLMELGRRRYVSPYGIASVYACLGEIDLALDWLDKAYAEHDQTLVWVKVHPRLDPLRSQPRYQELLRRMNLT